MQDDTRDLDVEKQLEAWAGHSSVGASPELTRTIRNTLTASLAPVNPIPARRQLVLIFLAIFVAGAVGSVASVSRVGLQLMTPVQILGVSVILLMAGVLFAGKLAEQMIPGSRPGVPVWASSTLISAAVFGGLAALFPWQSAGMFISEGWPCALMQIAIMIPAIAVFWLFARRGALFASAELGATVTGLAAVLVLIPVQFHCMFQQAPHLLVWHGGTALLVTGIGAFGGALWRGRWSS